MSDGRGQEYLDENFCTHDNVYINFCEIINNGDDIRVSITCGNCGASQEHTLDTYAILDDLNLGWEE